MLFLLIVTQSEVSIFEYNIDGNKNTSLTNNYTDVRSSYCIRDHRGKLHFTDTQWNIRAAYDNIVKINRSATSKWYKCRWKFT